MALTFLDNISYKGQKPNVERDQFKTIADMVAFEDDYLPDTFIATCIETGKAYLYNRQNEVDAVLGKWRLLVPAAEGSSVLNEDLTASISIGGISENKKYTSGTSLEQILTDLLAGAEPAAAGKYYYGVSDDEEVTLEELSETEVKPNALVKITAENQYIIFVVPSNRPIEIYDTNGLNNTKSFNISQLVVGEIEYSVYCSEVKVTCVDFGYKLIY